MGFEQKTATHITEREQDVLNAAWRLDGAKRAVEAFLKRPLEDQNQRERKELFALEQRYHGEMMLALRDISPEPWP